MRHEFTDEDDITFAENDGPEELYRAVDYLHRQVAALLQISPLTEEEENRALNARENLLQLRNSLRDRRVSDKLDREEWATIADTLDGEHDLAVDIVRALDEHSGLLADLGDPPNVHAWAQNRAEEADAMGGAIRSAFLAETDGGVTEDDLDLSDTVFSEVDPVLIDSNGEKYLCGWDNHGWFTILHVRLYPNEDAEEDEPSLVPERESPPASFTPVGVSQLILEMESGTGRPETDGGHYHQPTDDIACPECDSTPDLWTALPHTDMDEFSTYQSSLVVPYRCDECETNFEIVYEADKLGY